MRPAYSLATAVLALTVTFGLVMGPPGPSASRVSRQTTIVGVPSGVSDEGRATPRGPALDEGEHRAPAEAPRRQLAEAPSPQLGEAMGEPDRMIGAPAPVMPRVRVARARGVRLVRWMPMPVALAMLPDEPPAARDIAAEPVGPPPVLWVAALTYVEIQAP